MFFCLVYLIVLKQLLILLILWKTFHVILTMLCDNKKVENRLAYGVLAFLWLLRLLILINIIHCLGHSIQILYVEAIYNQFVRPTAQMVSLFLQIKIFLWKFSCMRGYSKCKKNKYPNETPFKKDFTTWKVSVFEVFTVPCFLAFGLNTERYGVSLHIQSECGKMWTRKISEYGYFSCSDLSKRRTWSNRGSFISMDTCKMSPYVARRHRLFNLYRNRTEKIYQQINRSLKIFNECTGLYLNIVFFEC